MSDETPQRASEPVVTENLEERIAKARQSAQEWRERLGVTGEATLADTERLVAEAVPDAKIHRGERGGFPPMAYPGSGSPLLLLSANYSKEEDREVFAWFVGVVLIGWRPSPAEPPGSSTQERVAAFRRKVDAEDQLACVFRDVWIHGPSCVYGADDPRTLELLAPLGLDHYPTLEEACQLAASRPEKVSVKVEPLTRPYVLSMLGELVFCFPKE